MIIEKVTGILSKQLNVAAETIKPETNIATDLGADSLDLVEILMTLEDEFNVSIPDEDVPTIKTVKDLADYIESHK